MTTTPAQWEALAKRAEDDGEYAPARHDSRRPNSRAHPAKIIQKNSHIPVDMYYKSAYNEYIR